MFRSAFGIISLVLLGVGVFVPQGGLHAVTTGSEAEHFIEATESGAAPTVVNDGAAILDKSKLVGRAHSGDRRRAFGSEPSMLLLMGLALFASAHVARRSSRTHQ